MKRMQEVSLEEAFCSMCEKYVGQFDRKDLELYTKIEFYCLSCYDKKQKEENKK